MATKDHYPANTEWEVVSEEYIADDKNYRVICHRRIPKKPGSSINTASVVVRTPYKPRVGQFIKLSRQDA